MARTVLTQSSKTKQRAAVREVARFHAALGPFVVAADTTRMPMLFTDAAPGHPIIFVNDSLIALTGYSREDILAQPLAILFEGKNGSNSAATVKAAMEDPPEGPLEVECCQKDGEDFLASLYVSPVRDEAGKIVQHFLSLMDLTAHQQHEIALEQVVSLQAKLIHAARVSAMGTMVTTLAHELNQPLTAISNYAAAARMDMTGPIDLAELADSLQNIQKSASYAGAIISRLRAMVGGEASQAESFDLNEAVRECVTLLRMASCDGVRIDCETEGEMIVVGDRVQIQQVVINLAKNGCEAASERPNGHVNVATGIVGDRALVTVDNSGPAIDPAAAPDLFDWSHSAKPDGMGLGLAISQTIVHAHNGEIWYAGRDHGQTRFRFSVPLHCP